ncbi:MAG: glycosyltransferase family 39 protein [Pyrinomonadaceae bacterium]
MHFKLESTIDHLLQQLIRKVFAATLLNPSSFFLTTLILGLFIGVRLWRLTSSCLWFDEIFSVHAASYDWTRLLSFVAADIIHPPLFYALLKVWIAIGGESLPWLRLLPVLISFAAVVPFFMLCRELGLRAADTKFALLLMAVNGYLIKYAQEVRMYSLLLFFAVCSLWLFIRFIRSAADSKKQLLVLSALNLLLVYTHYYGWLLIATEAAFLLLWRRDKLPGFSIAAGILLLCFSPWVYTVTRAGEPSRGLMQNIGWVARPRLEDVARFFTLLNEPFYFRQSTSEPLYYRWSAFAGLLIFGLPLIRLAWRTLRGKRQEEGKRTEAIKWLLLFFCVPLALAFFFSWIFPYSVWGTRHLIIVAVPYAFLAAISLNSLRPQLVRLLVFGVMITWFVLAGTLMVVRPERSYIWCAWEELGRRLSQQQAARADVVKIYAFEDLIAYHLWFALGRKDGERYKVGVVKGMPGLGEDPAYFLPRAFSAIEVRDQSTLNEEHFWIAFRDTSWDETSPPLKTLTERGYTVRKVLETSAGGQRAFLVELQHD